MTDIKTRLQYSAAVAAVILLGLVSRRIPVIPPCVGDALWAVVVFFCWRIVLVKKHPRTAAAAALVTSFAVEFSQLIRWDWLVKVRETTIGHLLLGQGFVWSDLAAYAVGIGVALLCVTAVGRSK